MLHRNEGRDDSDTDTNDSDVQRSRGRYNGEINGFKVQARYQKVRKSGGVTNGGSRRVFQGVHIARLCAQGISEAGWM